jgi:hypothetical protein
MKEIAILSLSALSLFFPTNLMSAQNQTHAPTSKSDCVKAGGKWDENGGGNRKGDCVLSGSGPAATSDKK